MSATGSVFIFFFHLGQKAKRTKFFFILSLLPVLLAVFLRLQQVLTLSRRNMTGLFFYSNVVLPFYVQFLLLMLALLRDLDCSGGSGGADPALSGSPAFAPDIHHSG